VTTGPRGTRLDALARIELALESAVMSCESGACAPGLAAAIRYAVFPGGARIRPRLCLAVAAAAGSPEPAIVVGAASVELLHCASLVHDDLPCFDAAETRRGRATVQARFGEPLAVLAGDALIVLAFQSAARAFSSCPTRLPAAIELLGRASGAPCGIASGQAWECEPDVPVGLYHQQKTGALFVASAGLGALGAGVDPQPWQRFGAALGEAYQVADDVRDVLATADDLGKPSGRDAALARPSAVRDAGLATAVRRFLELVDAAVAAIPSCPGETQLRTLTLLEARRLLPEKLLRRAA
jgi:geranylgeranyl diphosphate synthase type II